MFSHCVNIDIATMYKVTTYVKNNVTFIFFDDANSDVGENKYANIGHASANVYFIGPQYDTDTPVNIMNNISTTLSTTMYNEINVNIYV